MFISYYTTSLHVESFLEHLDHPYIERESHRKKVKVGNTEVARRKSSDKDFLRENITCLQVVSTPSANASCLVHIPFF